MSWARWGSPCFSGIPPLEIDNKCNPCPGSYVYVYESGDEGEENAITCCSCMLNEVNEKGWREDFACRTAEEMRFHLVAHSKSGHHVRPSLLLPKEEHDILFKEFYEKENFRELILEGMQRWELYMRIKMSEVGKLFQEKVKKDEKSE